MATSAEEVLPKRVTPLVRLVGELHITHLAHVAVHVEVFLHGNHSYGFLGALHRRDSLTTGGALGGKYPMEVVDAVDLVVEVDGEGDAVEALVAHAAPEAAGVVRLAHRLQDLSGENAELERDSWDGIKSQVYHFHDQMPAHSALLGGLLESGILKVQ